MGGGEGVTGMGYYNSKCRLNAGGFLFACFSKRLKEVNVGVSGRVPVLRTCLYRDGQNWASKQHVGMTQRIVFFISIFMALLW